MAKGKKKSKGSKVRGDELLPGVFSGTPTFVPGLGFTITKADTGESASEKTASTLPAEITALLDVDLQPRQSLIPANARSAKWEDLHEFHRSSPRPKRLGHEVHAPDPPIAMICPDADCGLRQAPLLGQRISFFGDESRRPQCRYCGLTFALHGSRILYWREG